MGIKNISVSVLSFLAGITMYAQEKEQKITKYQELFNYSYEQDLFNGCVAVVEKGEIIFSECYGYTDKYKIKTLTADSQFLLASVSKHMTAMGIVVLKTSGKLQYDDKVTKYIPDFPYQQITIRHLLNQTSGIPEYYKILNNQRERLQKQYDEEGKIITSHEVANMFNKRKPTLDFETGTKFDYSNTNYVYLTEVIAAVSGMSFSSFMDKNIFKPLKMNRTLVYTNDTSVFIEPTKAFKRNLFSNELEDNHVPPYFNVVGDGGICSTINDLILWDKALRNETLVSNSALEEVYETPLISGEKMPYGFGWFVKDLPFNGHKAASHSGGFVGYENSVFRDLDEHNTVILLSNNSSQIRPELNSNNVRILYGAPSSLPKITADRVLIPMIMKEGIKKTEEFFEKAIKESKDTYDFSEKLMNRVGYDLLNNNNVTEAIAIFQWNIEQNPGSANAFDSLGEAYLKDGQNNKALINYQKALELNPNNPKAIEIVKKLKNEN